MRPVHPLLRSLATLAVLALLVAALFALWQRYQTAPLTRDGKLRADVIAIAPDVSGLVTDVRVHDNQRVRRGEVLMQIDQPRYRLALAQAQAQLDGQAVALAQARREDQRNRALGDVVAAEAIEQGRARLDSLAAAVAQARAARDLARLNLDRTLVRAPVDGTLTNVSLQPGAYLAAGKPALALVYDRSLRAEGYFEETKLPAVRVGDAASIYAMGMDAEIRGHVESIAGGVEDRERAGGEAQLANVNPAFTWVRLAQRIPVRIAIDAVPPGVRLLPGQTVTVVVHPRHPAPAGSGPWPW